VWDATNVADADVAVITPIGMDHEQWLGDDIRDIATEKAGIIKPGCAAVIAAQVESVVPILADAVAQAGARAVWEAAEFAQPDAEGIEVLERQPGVGGQLVTLRTSAPQYAQLCVPPPCAY